MEVSTASVLKDLNTTLQLENASVRSSIHRKCHVLIAILRSDVLDSSLASVQSLDSPYPGDAGRVQDYIGQWARKIYLCGLSSIPGPGVICGLSLFLDLYSALRGFSPGSPVFPSTQKPTFPYSNSILECTGISNEFL